MYIPLDRAFAQVVKNMPGFLYDVNLVKPVFEAAFAGNRSAVAELRDIFQCGWRAKRNLDLAEFFNEYLIASDLELMASWPDYPTRSFYWLLRNRAAIETLRMYEGNADFQAVKAMHLEATDYMFSQVHIQDWSTELLDNLKTLTEQQMHSEYKNL